MKDFHHFSNISKDQLRHYQRLSVNSSRSAELAVAWLSADKLRAQYREGDSVKEIAERWGINRRAAYRIIKGK